MSIEQLRLILCDMYQMDLWYPPLFGKWSDDFKKASGGIYLSLKRRLSLTQCGNNPDPFIRDTLSPLLTPDMDVYKDLEAEIFGDDKNGGTTNG